MSRHPLLLLCAATAACSYPQHEARTEQEFSVPVGAINSLACTTHNGGITVTGVPGVTEVEIKATLRVRGYTEAEAQANLQRLLVIRKITGGTLEVYGQTEPQLDWNLSPSFAFAITAPPEWAAKLTSHNGDVVVREIGGNVAVDTHNGGVEALGLVGSVRVGTHNGSVRIAGRAARFDLVSHNGRIVASAEGDGNLDGKVETHNGAVELALGARSTVVEASTHNGSVSVTSSGIEQFQRSADEDQVRFAVRGGKGSLIVTTHNGDIVLR